MSTVFRHGRIFDGIGGELLEGVEVLVEGDRIAEVSDVPIRSRTAEVIDLQGRTLMPGLIDAHFHALAASPDLGAVENMPASLLAQHARLNLEATLRRGFTTVRDAAGADYGLARAIDAELLGRPGELGTVVPGALADLIAVDGDPVADLGVLSGQGERITLVMKGGRIYKRTG